MVSAMLVGFALVVAGAAEPEAAKPAEADQAAYESARAAAGRDAHAHVALALWCEAHGMAAEKATHLARAVLLDPSHARARGLLGYVKHDGKWMRPEEVSKAVEDSPEAQALFREYQQRRVKARDKADDQYKLARWCDEHGLAQQATAHYHRVVELDPGRDSAWKHLGFKKVSGRWTKPEILAAEKAEREVQAKADKFWRPRLEKIKEALSGRDKAKKAEAEQALAGIDDPRAVPMVWKVFARGDERWQRVSAQVLGQIDGPAASEALAVLAVFSPVANIRSEATQRLMRRDPRDFATLLAGLLREEIRYKVKPVEGPGSQGELFVEGNDANVRRRYTPLQRPVTLPGDRPGVTDFGMYVVNRDIGIPYVAGPTMSYGEVLNSMFRPRISSEKASALFQAVGLSQDSSQALAAQLAKAPAPLPIVSDAATQGTPLAMSNYQQIRTDTLQIPMEWMIAEARASAVVAQRQLTYDVAQIESHNAPIREVNERASSILRGVSGQDLGVDPQKWTAWAVDLQGYAFRASSPEPTPPTVTMDVPLNFQPQAVPTVASRVVGFRRSHSCFAAGTLVRTLRGARPIESIRPGDQVLAQDTADGRFDYRPVVTAYHNPPNETYRLDLGGESIVATGIHRFWKAGRGWVMARDVKAGDRLRTVGGAVEVVAVEKDKVQPVYNLRLDGGDDFCVGESGVIAHDNSFVEPVDRPFDAVPTLAAAGPAGTP